MFNKGIFLNILLKTNLIFDTKFFGLNPLFEFYISHSNIKDVPDTTKTFRGFSTSKKKNIRSHAIQFLNKLITNKELKLKKYSLDFILMNNLLVDKLLNFLNIKKLVYMYLNLFYIKQINSFKNNRVLSFNNKNVFITKLLYYKILRIELEVLIYFFFNTLINVNIANIKKVLNIRSIFRIGRKNKL